MSDYPPELDTWIAALAPELGIHDGEVPVEVILEVAKTVAHGAVRPGAPVSAFMIGLALGLGQIATPQRGLEAVERVLESWQVAAPTDGKAGPA